MDADTDIFLNITETPKLSTEKINFWKMAMTEKDLYESKKRTENDKSPENNGLTSNHLISNNNNWRPVSLLNVDVKMISNMLSKKVLSNINFA